MSIGELLRNSIEDELVKVRSEEVTKELMEPLNNAINKEIQERLTLTENPLLKDARLIYSHHFNKEKFDAAFGKKILDFHHRFVSDFYSEKARQILDSGWMVTIDEEYQYHIASYHIDFISKLIEIVGNENG